MQCLQPALEELLLTLQPLLHKQPNKADQSDYAAMALPQADNVLFANSTSEVQTVQLSKMLQFFFILVYQGG